MKAFHLVVLALLIGACGGEGGTLGSDLLAVTAVVSVPAGDLVLTGMDVSGDVINPASAQPRLEIFAVPGGGVLWLQGAEPSSGDVVFSRDPLAAGASGPLLDAGVTVVAVLRPLITPTAGDVGLDAWLIALDQGGAVIAADWEGAELEKLKALLLEGDDPVTVIGMAVDGLAARELGRPVDPKAIPLLEILDR